MEKEHKKGKENGKKHDEPKISELEERIDAFRHAHGHSKLIEEIKTITKNSHKEKTSKKAGAEEKHELKISDIEKIFRIFGEEHGHEKLKESINEATKNIKKETTKKSPEHIVYTDKENNKQSIKKARSKNSKEFIVSTFLFIKEKMKHKKFRYPSIAFGVFLGLYILFNLPIIYTRISWHKPVETQKVTVKTQEVVQKKMADSAALTPGEVVPAESRIVIPKLKVNAPIVYADTIDEKSIEGLLHNGVVHYRGTANPGEVGNSFITGHSSNYWWDTGKYNYVFVLLDKLEPGDQAVIYYNGKKFVYTVRDKVVVEATDVSVLAPTNTPTLSLMTCTPPGTSWKRLIVRLDQTDPVYYKPETVTKEKVVETPKPQEKKKSFFESIFSLFTPN